MDGGFCELPCLLAAGVVNINSVNSDYSISQSSTGDDSITTARSFPE
jgi:hypothetical protein